MKEKEILETHINEMLSLVDKLNNCEIDIWQFYEETIYQLESIRNQSK